MNALPETILVTGATGFIGRHVVAQLRAEGARRILGLVRTVPTSSVHGDGPHLYAPWRHLPQLLSSERVDACVHLAWYAGAADYLSSPANADSLRDSNLLVESLARAGIGHFVGVGTCFECLPDNHPLRTTAYVQAKLSFRNQVEQICAVAGIRFTWARIFFPYGPGEPARKLVSLIAGRILRGEPLHLQAPDNEIDLIFVHDVARAVATILSCRLANGVDIGTGRTTSVRAVATAITDVIGRQPAEWPATTVGQRMPVADTGRLGHADWTPTVSLAEGIRLTLDSLSP